MVGLSCTYQLIFPQSIRIRDESNLNSPSFNKQEIIENDVMSFLGK